MLGLSEGYRVDNRQSGGGRGVQVQIKSDSTDQYQRGSALLSLSGPTFRIRLTGQAAQDIDSQSDFISVGNSRPSLSIDDSAPNGAPSDRTEAFWAEEERLGTTRPDEKDLDDEQDTDLEREETLEEARRIKTIRFEQNLQADPSDIDTWIAYSQLQLGSLDRSNKSARKKAEQRVSTGQAEVATEILSKALKASPDNAKSAKLYSAFFKMVQYIWPAHEITSAWKKVLTRLTHEDTPTNGLDTNQALGLTSEVRGRELMDLWLEYVSWREGRGLGSANTVLAKMGGPQGGVDDVVEVYTDCIRVMVDAQRKNPESQSRRGFPRLHMTLTTHWHDATISGRTARGKPGLPPFAVLPLTQTFRYHSS